MFITETELRTYLGVESTTNVQVALHNSWSSLVALFGDVSSQDYTTKVATCDIYDDEILLPHIHVTNVASINGNTDIDTDILPPHDRKIRCKVGLDHSLRYQTVTYTAGYSVSDAPADLKQAQLMLAEGIYHQDAKTGQVVQKLKSGPREVTFAGESDTIITGKHQQLLSILGRYRTLSL